MSWWHHMPCSLFSTKSLPETMQPIRPLETNFNEICVKIHFFFQENACRILSAKYWPFYTDPKCFKTSNKNKIVCMSFCCNTMQLSAKRPWSEYTVAEIKEIAGPGISLGTSLDIHFVRNCLLISQGNGVAEGINWWYMEVDLVYFHVVSVS